MDYISLILYSGGVLGICLCIVLLGTSFHKRNKFFSFITLLMIFLSVSALGFGTVTTLIDKHTDSKNTTTLAKTQNTNETPSTSKEELSTNKDDKEASFDDLNFQYKIKNNQCYINITNNSSKIFNGSIELTFLDSNNSTVSTAALPISNLLPEKESSYTIETLNTTHTLNYDFKGNFTDEKDNNVGYTITSMGVGNGYIRFEIAPDKNDVDSLKNICANLKNTYNKDLCKGFIVYFVNTDATTLDTSFAEYFRNNESTTSDLVTYSDNAKYGV